MGQVKRGISACMMLKNEEKNLPGLLENINGVVDEIVAIDHESADSTKEILKNAGAVILEMPDPAKMAGTRWGDVERPMLNEHASHEWILHIDADERLTSELKANIRKLTGQNEYDVIWLYSRHFYAPGKWFRHGFYAPHREPRLYRKSCKTQWNVRIHEAPKIEGRPLYSDFAYDHLFYTAGEERIKKKHEIYLKKEREHKEEYLSKNQLARWFFIITGYPIYLVGGLFLKKGILDGWPGITTNHFLAMYFARAGWFEIFIKKKLGLIKYNPMLETERTGK